LELEDDKTLAFYILKSDQELNFKLLIDANIDVSVKTLSN
jgi:hypothetical protein